LPRSPAACSTVRQLIPELFWRLVPNVPERDVYLCGPPRMARAVRNSLRRTGLPEPQLHEERFDF
jgi:ferredoxin-NADP reductase